MSYTFKFQITSLTSGYCAGGYSTLLSIIKLPISSRDERDEILDDDANVTVLNRVMVNVGDGTQRFCSENRIKLSSLSTIIISSLSPHNLGGFPGIFLSLSDLGVANLNVIGPSGLKSCIDLMTPFINRRYPVLNIIEVDKKQVGSSEIVTQEQNELIGEYFSLRFCPIHASSNTSNVIGIATSILPHLKESVNPVLLTIIPIAAYFDTQPALEELQKWSEEVLSSGKERKVVLFAPLAVSSVFGEAKGALFQRLITLCDTVDAIGLVTTGLLAFSTTFSQAPVKNINIPDIVGGTLSEFRHCQSTLSLLHDIYPPFFPLPANCQGFNDADLMSRITTLENVKPLDTSTGIEAKLTQREQASRVVLAQPRLSLIFTINTESESKILSLPEKSFARLSLKQIARKAILFEKVLPNLVPKDSTVENLEELKWKQNDEELDPKMSTTIISTSVDNPIELNNVDNERNSGHEVVLKSRRLSLSDDSSNFITGNLNSLSSGEVALTQPERDEENVPPALSTASVGGTPDAAMAETVVGNSKLKLSLAELVLDDVDYSTPIASGPNSGVSAVSSLSHWSRDSYSGLQSPGSADNQLSRQINTWISYFQQNRSGETIEENKNVNKRKFGDQMDTNGQGLESEISPVPNIASLLLKGKEISTREGFVPQRVPTFSPVRGTSGNFFDKIFENTLAGDNVAPRRELQQPWLPPQPLPPNPISDIFQLSFLGTGSATPSKYRNSSCILISLPPIEQPSPSIRKDNNPFLSDNFSISSAAVSRSRHILLDVGEGSSSQLFQHCGADEERFDDLLLEISVIWISHHHADHCCGLPMLLENIQRAKNRSVLKQPPSVDKSDSGSFAENDFANELQSKRSNQAVSGQIRRQLQKQHKSRHAGSSSRPQLEVGKILLIASENVLAYVEYLSCVAGLEDLLCPYPISGTLYAGNKIDISAATDGHVTRILSIPVYHCQHSYGCVLEFQSSHKIVYSGDCRYELSLLQIEN